jgi:hypothetical protein
LFLKTPAISRRGVSGVAKTCQDLASSVASIVLNFYCWKDFWSELQPFGSNDPRESRIYLHNEEKRLQG